MGRVPDPAPLAALGVCSAVFSFAFFIFNFLATATTPLIAAALAAGDAPRAERTLAQALTASAAIGITSLVVLQLSAGPILHAMGTAPDALSQAEGYLRVRALAAPAVLAASVANGAYRGLLDTATPFKVTAPSRTWPRYGRVGTVAGCVGERGGEGGVGLHQDQQQLLGPQRCLARGGRRRDERRALAPGHRAALPPPRPARVGAGGPRARGCSEGGGGGARAEGAEGGRGRAGASRKELSVLYAVRAGHGAAILGGALGSELAGFRV